MNHETSHLRHDNLNNHMIPFHIRSFQHAEDLNMQVPAATNKQAITEILLNYNDGNGVFCWSATRLYNEEPKPAEIELRESPKMAVEYDWEEMARKELGCVKKTSCVQQTGIITVLNPLPGYD
jgi:hypothetical protein